MKTSSGEARRFVPRELNVAEFAQLEPLYRELIDRPIGSARELEKWLLDFSELSAVVDEYGSRTYIDKSCHTDDPTIEKRFLYFVEEIDPRIKPLFFALQKKFLESPWRNELTGERYAMLERKWRADVELFRDENVPLQTETAKLVNEYDKTCGAMMVKLWGKEYTLQQAARFVEEPDRARRREAWEAIHLRRLEDREAIEAIFDKLLPIRQKIAENAGLPDYRAYMWKEYKRFDYSPEDCLKFAVAIEETCVPVARRLDEERRQALGVERLRPWDLAVDPKGRPALRPFEETQVQQFIDKTREIFARMAPGLGEEFETLRTNGNLDLDSRKGKQPGGYQSSLEEVKQPFIFMNAAGVQRDVETLLHEGGHAFHYLAAREEPLIFLRSAPMEFCEVASMSMELLGSEHFEVFYPPEEAARAKRTLLEGIIRILPWIATIDSFQHWIYTHPGHSRQERKQEWTALLRRFGNEAVDWSGWEAAKESSWQRQLHLFHVPFYYVEYGIAQLGALQLWMKAMEDPRRALSNYRNGLKLGGTRPLPELFRATGINFDFTEKTLRPLMNAVGEELERLPR